LQSFKTIFNILWLVLLLCHPSIKSKAQTSGQAFLKNQLAFPRVAQAYKKYHDTLEKEFHKKGFNFPPEEILLRAFKSSNEMELWARNSDTAPYRLVRIFPICAMSGKLGPKTKRGDCQVPEGFYYVEQFNPQSNFHLSLGLDYPNEHDLLALKNVPDVKSKKLILGGDIFIHGGCVTIGCMPLTDEGIKQMYIICLCGKAHGQEYIPVQIYPTRFSRNTIAYLKREYGDVPHIMDFWYQLKEYYDFFEKTHKSLPLMYTADGRYSH